jgi:hypothetical protein
LSTDETFIREFEAGRWPLENWHHCDHIKLAYLYLRRYPLEEAASKLRDGIRAHNAAHGLPDLPTSGYHETMTRAWLHLVDLVISEYGPSDTADLFFEQHPELSQKKTLRLFYSRERFMSPEAKLRFVAPDLCPLPKSRASKPAV